MVCIYNGILFSHEKEGNPAICDMYGPRGYYTKWSQTEKKILCVIMYIWNLKQTQTHRNKSYVCGYFDVKFLPDSSKIPTSRIQSE